MLSIKPVTPVRTAVLILILSPPLVHRSEARCWPYLCAYKMHSRAPPGYRRNSFRWSRRPSKRVSRLGPERGDLYNAPRIDTIRGRRQDPPGMVPIPPPERVAQRDAGI